MARLTELARRSHQTAPANLFSPAWAPRTPRRKGAGPAAGKLFRHLVEPWLSGLRHRRGGAGSKQDGARLPQTNPLDGKPVDKPLDSAATFR